MGGAFFMCSSSKKNQLKKEITRKNENSKNEKKPIESQIKTEELVGKMETIKNGGKILEIQEIFLHGKTENLNEMSKNENEKEAKSMKINGEETKKTKCDIREIKEITSETTENPKKFQIKEKLDGEMIKNEEIKKKNDVQNLKNSGNNESTIISNFENPIPIQENTSSILKPKKNEIDESKTIFKKLGNQSKHFLNLFFNLKITC